MAMVTRCPKCGNVLSDDLGGKCPECMLQAGLTGPSVGSNGPETVDYATQGGAGEPRSTPQPGEDFGGYHLVRALGQGGMGRVFEAEERGTGRRLALKVLSHSLDSPTARQRFLREGRLAASVNHPRSVYVFGTEEIDGAPVITMELVPGGTLQERVRSKGPLPIADAVDAILQVLDGLEAALAVGVLHRDVKPSNCFVDADGTVKVGDFGLSISKFGRGDWQHLTNSGVFLGTPAFASPEQLRGDELDQRSDLYAIGVTLFYLLTGKLPFEAEQMVQLVATVLEKPAANVRSLRPEVPKELAAAVACLLEKDPARRYRSYGEVRSALLPFSSLVPTPATPVGRFSAGAIDYVIVSIVFTSFATLAAPIYDPDFSFGGQLLSHVLVAIGWFSYYALPEGVFGATLGKWLAGIRVVRAGTMHPPGFWRATLRTAIYKLTPALPAWIYWAIFGQRFVDADGQFAFAETDFLPTMAVAFFTAVPLWGLMFVTMRRGNGFAAIHDLLTDIRIIARPVVDARPAPLSASIELSPLVNGSPAFGPYHVLQSLGNNAAGEWQLGYDARLLRKVWLRIVPPGTAALGARLQGHSRAGRVRWLTGQRGHAGNWDAFEAPAGQPLLALLDRPQEWHDVRYWLLDLALELASGLKDDTLPMALALDRVWIGADGRAKLCDLPLPGSPPLEAPPLETRGGAIEPVRDFFGQVAAAALMGRRLSAADAKSETFARPLPLHARAVLDGLRTAQRPEVIVVALRSNVARPGRVSRSRRLGMFAAVAAMPLAMAILSFLGTAPVFLAAARNPELTELKHALNKYANPFHLASEPTPELKAALATFIVGRFGKRIEDPEFWKDPYLAAHILAEARKSAKEIVASTPQPSPEEFDKALAVVEPVIHPKWGSTGEGMGTPFLFFMPLAALGFFLWFEGLPSIFAALIFRGGPLWSAFGLVPVTADGRRASRLRFAWRQAVAWAPILSMPFLATLIVVAAQTAGLAFGILAGAICLVVLLAMIITSTFFCERSWPDRLAGTWLVMR